MRRAIETERLGKRYRLGAGFHRYQTLRDALSSLGRGGVEPDAAQSVIWALRDVDLAVDQSEAVGIVGRNGAGKTTLLKILARITEPTAGVARTRGRVGALLEVGTGFHPELTGRENVYLNGAVLGMSRRDIRRRFDDIVAFAEVERFLDTPLKRYSSGMYLRLAFAVAAHLEPDIVVVDEVLAVGDAEFHRKCLGKMAEIGREGRTVLFVSHDLGAVTQLCPRAIWLDEGSVRCDGPAAETINAYLASTGRQSLRSEFPTEPGHPVQLVSVALTDERGEAREVPRRDEQLCIQLCFRTHERVPGLDFGVYVMNSRGVPVLEEYWSDRHADATVAVEPGDYEASVMVPPVLPAGEYVVGAWVGSTYDELSHREAFRFQLLPSPDDRQESLERARVVQPPLQWHLRRRLGDRVLLS
jgi:ABC-type polysaccharide/polyol phosphate transport system ATPase subunit